MNRSQIEADIHQLVTQKNYPCVAAVQALYRKEYMYDVYADFGSGKSGRKLAENLIQFKQRQQAGKLAFLTYFALFPQDQSQTESEFEQRLWAELSAAATVDSSAWDSQFSDNPEDKNFCFSLDGSAFFVVGMNAVSSRKSRRFPYDALVFNLYSQFHDLMQEGVYDNMVKLNRERDLRFEGSVNPMVEKYNEQWESIQFSGRQNNPEWKCPFKKGLSFLTAGLL
jgi:FPC/CPF motif-containing protein YcgG